MAKKTPMARAAAEMKTRHLRELYHGGLESTAFESLYMCGREGGREGGREVE